MRPTPTIIPPPRESWRPSLPALGLILASLILAIILGVVTWRNLDREERLMEEFLLKEGLTLIRAFEAGARTSMMMNWAGGSLDTLVKETSRMETVAYVLIFDESGRLVTAAGEKPDGPLPVKEVLALEEPLTRRLEAEAGEAVFEVSKEFTPVLEGGTSRRNWMGRGQRWSSRNWGWGPEAEEGRRAIFVGLYTGDFEAARREDVRRSLLMGGLLLLLGSTGFYFLFLAQKNRTARATLANMELYTRNVIESMPAGLVTLDRRGRIVSLNSRGREIFGVGDESVEGRPMDALTAAGQCDLEPLLRENGEFVERPMECLDSQGKSVPVSVSASRLTDRSGESLGSVVIIRDMREIRAMEEALERARRHAALGRMAAGIAHEIRNPLGTLRGFAQFFARRNREDATAGEYADLMVGEVDRLNRTVSTLLQFARPREPELSPVDIPELLKRIARLLEDEMASGRISLQLDLPAESVSMIADPDLLTQVLINLLQNALAASETGSGIRLGGEKVSAEARLWVQDDGKGMSPEEREKMFDPFFTTRREGTGLGLAMVQQIVEQHGGRIEVVTAPERGTRVEIILPQEVADGEK